MLAPSWALLWTSPSRNSRRGVIPTGRYCGHRLRGTLIGASPGAARRRQAPPLMRRSCVTVASSDADLRVLPSRALSVSPASSLSTSSASTRIRTIPSGATSGDEVGAETNSSAWYHFRQEYRTNWIYDAHFYVSVYKCILKNPLRRAVHQRKNKNEQNKKVA